MRRRRPGHRDGGRSLNGKPRLGARGWRAVLAGTGLVVASVMPGFLTASVAPRIRADFAFSDASLGLAVALFYVVSAAASVPAGHLVERIGPARSMYLALASMVVSCLGIALLASSALSLTALLLVEGIANAIITPCVAAVFAREVVAERQGFAYGTLQAGAPIGAMLAGLALPLIAIPFGWRSAFVAAAALCLVCVIASPRPGAAVSRATSSAGDRPRGVGPVHALGLAAVLASAASLSVASFLVTYCVANGISEASAGLLLAALSLLSTASRLVVGAALDRGRLEPLNVVAWTLALSAPAYLLLTAGEPALIVAAALLAGALGWSWPGGLTLAVVQRTPGAPAWAVSVLMTGLFAGAVAGPFATGFLAEADMFTAAWIACAGMALLAVVPVVVTMRRDRRPESAPAA